ncbi:MAG: proprotein convertase P-domain-containing protein [Gammaproteobacteria bacterium]
MEKLKVIARTLIMPLLLSAPCVLAQSSETVTFETIPGGTPTDGLPINTQFLADFGIAFSLEGGGFPVLAQVGEPRTAFQGFNLLADQPAPGTNTGSFFLTDDGGIAGPPTPIIISYANPVAAASGVLLDIDGMEGWQIQARDANDSVIDTVDLVPNLILDGSATLWSFTRPTADIHSIRMVYTGTQTNFVGLAFDNFSPAAPTGLFCSSPDAAIPDNTPGGVSDVLSITELGSVIDMSVSLNISHPYIGNLVANLTNNTTGASIELINSPGSANISGGCPFADVDVALDDDASELTSNACDNASPALGGSWKPNEMLSTFEGSDFTGDWTLQVIDTTASNAGTLNQWCLDIVAGPPVPDTDEDGVNDELDNCTVIANSTQIDTDGDGYGNSCDADFNNDCIVNFLDIASFANEFLGVNPLFDINSDGNVNFLDFSFVSQQFLQVPGPGQGSCL